ncbi:YqaI family protein [Niallia sp. 03091]
MNLEHPMITRINDTGYPSKDIEPVEKASAGTDYFGNEIFVGDEVVVHNGETILVDSLEDYLIEVLEFEFKKAE